MENFKALHTSPRGGEFRLVEGGDEPNADLGGFVFFLFFFPRSCAPPSDESIKYTEGHTRTQFDKTASWRALRLKANLGVWWGYPTRIRDKNRQIALTFGSVWIKSSGGLFGYGLLFGGLNKRARKGHFKTKCVSTSFQVTLFFCRSTHDALGDQISCYHGNVASGADFTSQKWSKWSPPNKKKNRLPVTWWVGFLEAFFFGCSSTHDTLANQISWHLVKVAWGREFSQNSKEPNGLGLKLQTSCVFVGKMFGDFLVVVFCFFLVRLLMTIVSYSRLSMQIG